MKILVLILSLTGLFSVSAFAQVNQNLKGNRTPNDLAKAPEKSMLFENELFDGSAASAGKFFPKNYSDLKDLSVISKKLKKSTKPSFSMPVLVPQGSFNMKVHEPDSTAEYKMRVKKF